MVATSKFPWTSGIIDSMIAYTSSFPAGLADISLFWILSVASAILETLSLSFSSSGSTITPFSVRVLMSHYKILLKAAGIIF